MSPYRKNPVENESGPAAIKRQRSVVDHISCDAAGRSPIADQERPATDRGAPAIGVGGGQDQCPSAAFRKGSGPGDRAANGRLGTGIC